MSFCGFRRCREARWRRRLAQRTGAASRSGAAGNALGGAGPAKLRPPVVEQERPVVSGAQEKSQGGVVGRNAPSPGRPTGRGGSQGGNQGGNQGSNLGRRRARPAGTSCAVAGRASNQGLAPIRASSPFKRRRMLAWCLTTISPAIATMKNRPAWPSST